MCQDEGARYIAAYVCQQSNCTILELLDCGITTLGCEFLQKACYPLELNSPVGSNLTILKLDHNPIGAKGMNMLAEGLSRNPGFQQLSFTYCNIGPEGGEGIKKILIYSKSQLLEKMDWVIEVVLTEGQKIADGQNVLFLVAIISLSTNGLFAES